MVAGWAFFVVLLLLCFLCSAAGVPGAACCVRPGCSERPWAARPCPPDPPAPSTPVALYRCAWLSASAQSPPWPCRHPPAPQPGPLTPLIPVPTPNFARNSASTLSNFEFRTLELQRFSAFVEMPSNRITCDFCQGHDLAHPTGTAGTSIRSPDTGSHSKGTPERNIAPTYRPSIHTTASVKEISPLLAQNWRKTPLSRTQGRKIFHGTPQHLTQGRFFFHPSPIHNPQARQNSPCSAPPAPRRDKIRPARAKHPKISVFSPAGRILSRSHPESRPAGRVLSRP